MKTKLLFSACALAAVFAACNNEELVVDNNNAAQTATQEIVGAKLVSEGLSLDLGESRVNTNGWENGDKMALAWYNVASQYGGQIYNLQLEKFWNAITTGNLDQFNDSRIYANNVFTYQNGNFVTTANIYEGGYFVYWPYQYQKQVAQLKININPKQETDFVHDHLNNALHISAQDFIGGEEDAAVTDSELKKAFVLSPMVNALKVIATPTDEVKEAKILSTGVITKVTLTAPTNAGFRSGVVEINPAYIPAVVRNEKGAILTDETLAAMDNYAATNIASGFETSRTLAVEVDNKDYDLTEARNVRAFTLPTAKGYTYSSKTAPNSTITVAVKIGQFTGSFRANNTTLTEALTEAGAVLGDGKKHSLTSIVRAANNKWATVGLDAELTAANFTLNNATIKTVDEWNAYVALVDEVAKLQGEKAAVKQITLSKDLEFSGKINTPETVAIKVKTNGNAIKIVGDTEWPANLIGVDGTNGYANVEVEEGATLTVTNDNTANGSLIDFKTAEGGVINLADAKAKIHVNGGDNDGRILIGKYGAQVQKGNGDDFGTIAFVVEEGIENLNWKINHLIASSEQQNFAYVNTLIVKNTTFDLSGTNGKVGEIDPYTGKPIDDTTVKLNSLENIDIELESATITAKNGTVNSITVVSGSDNVIKDVTTDSLAVNSGAKATIKTASTDKDASLSYNNILVNPNATLVADGVIVKYTDWTTTNGTTSAINNGKFEKAN